MTGVLLTPLLVERLAVIGGRLCPHVARGGFGPEAAAATVRQLGSRVAGGVLVAGVAGGLGPAVQPGDLVVATEIRGAGRPVPVPAASLLAAALRRAGLRAHLGPLLSVPRLLPTGARRAWAQTGAIAVDMEAAAVAAAVARIAPGAPVAAVRAIVDTDEHPLSSVRTPWHGMRALAALHRAGPIFDEWVCATGTPREVLLAAPRSFCAGVRRAIEIVERALDRYGAPVYVRRQIVHNRHVVADLERRGAVFVEELSEVPPGATAVLAAHGVAPSVRAEAAARDLQVIDATCPLVTKVHAEARRFASRGDTVLLIGHGDHEEVVGTVGEAPQQIVVVSDAAEAGRVVVDDPERVAYVPQTPLSLEDVDAVAQVLRERFPAIRAPRSDDVCYATTNRQQAVRAVAADADVILVLGSDNSSNSRRLVEVAERCGVPAHLVDDAESVELDWLIGSRRIGVTAGASAPPTLVTELVDCLAGLGPVTTRDVEIVDETIDFGLPPEVG
jgi:4-hydroxy-3-methylbut-2-enyl diphosphate reductase